MITAAHLIEVARSWLGTPFHAGAAVKGVGVSCSKFVEEVFLESGVSFPKIERDSIRGDYFDYALSLCEENFKEREGHEPGAIIICRGPRIFNHFGIATTDATLPAVIHCASGLSISGVIEHPLPEIWERLEVRYFWHPEVVS